ncbi:MAG TPA: VWA domain-containing protein, partial [Pyrinomonadaceae bacterium]
MRHRITLALFVSFCTFLPVAPLAAQTKPAGEQDDVVRITTNLVQVDAVVTKDGKPVRDLKAEDFEIYQDGKKQTITTFAYISNVSPDSSSPADKSSVTVPGGPIKRDVARRTIAIVIDDLALSFESIHHIRRQLRKFIAEELQPNDLVAVIRTGGEMGALQQFTNDKRLLNRAVEQIRWNLCSRVGISPLPRIGDTGVGACDFLGSAGTMNSLRFILDSMGRLPGRKSMILMSDAIPVREDQAIVGGDES